MTICLYGLRVCERTISEGFSFFFQCTVCVVEKDGLNQLVDWFRCRLAIFYQPSLGLNHPMKPPYSKAPLLGCLQGHRCYDQQDLAFDHSSGGAVLLLIVEMLCGLFCLGFGLSD